MIVLKYLHCLLKMQVPNIFDIFCSQINIIFSFFLLLKMKNKKVIKKTKLIRNWFYSKLHLAQLCINKFSRYFNRFHNSLRWKKVISSTTCIVIFNNIKNFVCGEVVLRGLGAGVINNFAENLKLNLLKI